MHQQTGTEGARVVILWNYLSTDPLKKIIILLIQTIRSLVGARSVAADPMDDAESEAPSKPVESIPDNASEITEDQDVKEEKEEKSETKAADASEAGDESKDQDASRPSIVYYSGSALTEAMQQFPESELKVTTPLQDGVVKDWAAMEALWQVNRVQYMTFDFFQEPRN